VLLPVLLFGILAVFFPFGIYCLILSRLNGRRHPTVLGGMWDFALLLFSVSGLLLVLGPGILTGFTYDLREVWLRLHYDALKGTQDHVGMIWRSIWYGYFALILGGSALILYRRRRVTAIYNADFDVVEEAMTRSFERHGLLGTRTNDRLVIRFPGRFSAPAAPALASITAGSPATSHDEPSAKSFVNGHTPTANAPPAAVVQIVPFEFFRHVTLYWRQAPPAFQKEFERELVVALREVSVRPTGIATLFAWLSAAILVSLFFFTAVMQFLIIISL
jgi:hypothetical protein